MGDHSRAVLDVHECNVRRSRDHAAAAQRRHVARRLTEPVLEDREVVRPEVPDDARVRLVQPQVHATRRDEVDVAELTRHDQLLHELHGRAVEERVPRHEHEPALRGESHELLPLLERRGEWLFDEHVLPRLERGVRESVMGADRRCDRDDVDLRVGEDTLVLRRAARGRIPGEQRLERRRAARRTARASSAPGRPTRFRTRFGPQYPSPTTAKRRSVMPRRAGGAPAPACGGGSRGRDRATSRGHTRRPCRAPRRTSTVPAPSPARAR